MKSSFSRRVRFGAAFVSALAYLGLTACSSADSELARFLEDIKRQSGGPVEPLPEIKPYEAFVYDDFSLRSPFLPSSPGSGAGQPQRNREFLEQYSLDTLKMVGTLHLATGQTYGLVETKDGLVHRVSAGDHMGQAQGKITDITPSKIDLVERVPDERGGWMERPAALGLNE